METITLPHLPDYPLRVCLFTNVRNASFLRQQLLEGNNEFEYAFLEAAALLSRTQVLDACFRAINDMLQGRLKCRNVHAEIVFSFSPNNNVGSVDFFVFVLLLALLTMASSIEIAESFRRFGVGDMTRHILAIKVGGVAAQVEEHLLKHVEGRLAPFTDDELRNIQDGDRIKKAFKLNEISPNAEPYVLGSMALKGS